MKIAIIGSGISGLTTAYLLHKDHDITVFEANDYIGGHTHTHEISQNNKMWKVDSGFIVYNEKTYPNFIKLLKKLKVKVQKTTMGFSVKAPSQNLEYSGGSLNTVFAQRLNLFKPAFLIMLKDVLRFNRLAAKELSKADETTTILSFLEKHKFSKPFVENYIIPMGAAIWSTAANKTTEMPAAFFIRFFKNHGLLQIFNRPQWFVIKGGSKSYVQKIIEGFQEKILLSKPVIKVERNPSEVKIYCEKEADPLFFDKVVFATHSDQALALLKDPSNDEKSVLEALPYQKNTAIVHTDVTLMPKIKKTWSSWNYLLSGDPNRPVTLTYNMNILQSLDAKPDFLVTLNSLNEINPSKIIKKIDYSHPLFTVNGVHAQKKKNQISGQNNTYYCGAYWGNGFHEDGVNSALDVCKAFGVSL
ncbi:NAD(P)/FAD-dependent oxidoreductase [Pseudothioglobus sp. nBUS_23]|uniref:NAD(P)/FAD-dependent oxidoreductase n=1 Tax=Pseudothioglobus sp. nBUS_23 TaxID=3395318 RepID=UPI003EC11F46